MSVSADKARMNLEQREEAKKMSEAIAALSIRRESAGKAAVPAPSTGMEILKKRLTEMEQNLRHRSNQLITEQTDRKKIEETLADLKAQQEVTQRQLLDAQSLNKTKEKELAALQENLSNLNEQQQKTQRELLSAQNANKTKEKESEILKTKLSTRIKEVAELNSKLETEQSRAKEIAAEIKQKEDEIAELNKHWTDSQETNRENLANLKALIEIVKARDEEIAAHEEHVRQLVTQLTEESEAAVLLNGLGQQSSEISFLPGYAQHQSAVSSPNSGSSTPNGASRRSSTSPGDPRAKE